MKRTTKTNDGITAIYVRRSVSDKDKGNNSLSISAQKEECIRFVGECDYRIYCDDGKSGKDVMHRPAFMQMMSDAREGLISRIIVKKYDRFSRNMREYLNITDELDRYGVTVYSLSEPFNTETKEGRMMRNNLLNFAEFERETIAARVADAFQTKARETGFYQGGKVQFGYTPERRTVGGKTGSVLVPSENAEAVRVAYDLYQHPENSLTDIIRYMTENGINASRPTPRTKTGISNLDRSHLSRILENPLYVRADKEVYRYFLSKGYEMLDDIEAYDGIHGLFVHAGLDDTHFVKVAYHEGLVPAETWLRVQDRKSHQSKFPTNSKAMNSWLVGMVKCACCGYAMHFNHCANRKGVVYHRFIDYGKFTLNGCPTPPIQLKPRQVEDAVLKEMQKRIEQLKIAQEILGDKLVAVQNQYSPIHLETQDTLEYCAKEGLAFVCWSPLGGYRHPYDEHLFDPFREVAAKHGVSYQRVVLAWELAKGDHMFVIPGAHRPETILDSLKADELELTDEELAFLG